MHLRAFKLRDPKGVITFSYALFWRRPHRFGVFSCARVRLLTFSENRKIVLFPVKKKEINLQIIIPWISAGTSDIFFPK